MTAQTTTRAQSQSGPARFLLPVVPDDAANLPNGGARSLYVAGAGTLSVVDAAGTVVEIVSGAAQYHPIRVVRVRATGTTATGIVALY